MHNIQEPAYCELIGELPGNPIFVREIALVPGTYLAKVCHGQLLRQYSTIAFIRLFQLSVDGKTILSFPNLSPFCGTEHHCISMYMYIHPQTDPNSYHQVNCADQYPPIGLFTQICTHNHQDQRMNRKRDTYQKKFKLDFHAATQPTSMIIWHLIVICIEAHAKRFRITANTSVFSIPRNFSNVFVKMASSCVRERERNSTDFFDSVCRSSLESTSIKKQK